MTEISEDEVLDYINSHPLNDLGEIVDVLGEKAHRHRINHGGYVPLSVFAGLLAGGGISCSIELYLPSYEEGSLVGYAFKRRESAEQGRSWSNKYATPGAVLTIGSTQDSLFNRLNREIWGKNNNPSYLEGPTFFGNEMHYEIERKVQRMGLIYQAKLDKQDLQHLSGNWKIFSLDEILEEKIPSPRIVDHHIDVIKWIHSGEMARSLTSLPDRI